MPSQQLRRRKPPQKQELQHKPTGQQNHKADEADDRQRRQLRLLFFILLSIWTLAAIAAPIVALCITNNPLCLAGLSAIVPSAYVLHRITDYLFPKTEKDYEIELKRIEQSKDKRQNTKNSP